MLLVGPCCTMLKETAPTVSIVCNTSKIQGALWAVCEGRTGSPPQWVACILGIGEIRGADAPSAHAGVFGKGRLLEGSPHCFTPLELYFTTKRSELPALELPSRAP
jgi:hypothetical protein